MGSLEQLSLKKVDITGHVIGKFSTFNILQEYKNDTDAVLEVTYTFPISATGTVTGFTATIGEKIIKGIVKKKKEARKDYEKAMVKGDSAYLMSNDESNIFRMNIGKIAVGETVEVKIDYIDNFEIIDNQIKIHIPTIVPPRYQSEATARLAYAEHEVEYRANLNISLDKDLKIKDIESKTHTIKIENNTVTAKNIRLDKDFVLNIMLAEQMFTKGYCRDLPNGNKLVYLSFLPEIEVDNKNKPKDYIFLIDVSGSMDGYKIEQTKEAVIKCLKQLHEGDRFNVILFDSVYELFSKTPVEFNPENFEKVLKYVQSQHARGGTELFSALKEAVEQPGKEKIILLFTDGCVGNENEVAGYVRQHIGKNSLFVFGIDTSVNKKGLQSIAEAGRGKAEFIARDGEIKEIILRQFARISTSNLFEINLNPNSNKVIDKIEKQKVLFNNEFYDVLVETDRICDDFELQCNTDTQTHSFTLSKDTLEYSSLPLDKIYAAEQIKRVEKYIETHPYEKNEGYKEQIVEIAVAYQIDSKYTAFLAIYERGEKLTDIPLLQDTVLEAPAGWEKHNFEYECQTLAMPSKKHSYRNFFCKGLGANHQSSFHSDFLFDEDVEVHQKKIKSEPESKPNSLKSRIFNYLFDDDSADEEETKDEIDVLVEKRKPLKILFVCTMNIDRSKTAEKIYSGHPGLEVKSAGASMDAVVKLSPALIKWADVVFCMEDWHKKYIERVFANSATGKTICVLDIADYFEYMDTKLVEKIKEKTDAWLEAHA